VSESNYEHVRNSLYLKEWDEARHEAVDRVPTNEEILRLLDALHADIQGVEGAELEAAKAERYWNS
jgi:hypothetical protein